ncbi:MAG TPA: glycosyltransferase family 39 protein [Rhizomicrobium sp.]|nr:glycosyltransferase family 39 protein [Rhizomicrobium sp.]
MPDPVAAPQSPGSNRSADFCHWLGLLVIAQLVLWTVLPWLFARSLPLDVVSDGLAWGHEWQWGYYKHPPLPSWTVEVFFDVLGDIGPFLLSQLCIAATYIFVFELGRDILGGSRAAVGTLLLAGVYYFSIPTPEFNHNVAQMPVWAAACLCYFRAWQSGRIRWWLALGAGAGVGLLTKYSTAVLLFVLLVHFVRVRGARQALASVGAWLAVATCLMIVSMHVLWLLENGFPTLRYAAARAGTASALRARLDAPLKFFVSQAVDIAPAFLLAWVAGLRPAKSAGDGKLDFLLWMTLGPPVVTVVASLVTGMGLRDMWGAPMWNLAGLAIVASAAESWKSLAPKRLGAGIVALFGTGLSAYVLANVLVPRMEHRPSRIQWPDRALAQTFGAVWRQHVHTPLRIVAADGWLGGLVAMRAAPRPSVWTDADSRKAPWVTPDEVRHYGALVLWRIRPGSTEPTVLTGLRGVKILGRESFAWPDTPGSLPLEIGYGILPPSNR